jgi:hypothetical protein
MDRHVGAAETRARAFALLIAERSELVELRGRGLGTVGGQARVGRPRARTELKSLSHVLVGTIGGTWQAPASC